LPTLTGFNSVTANWPALVENSGWESMIKGKIIDTKQVVWSAYFNIGINRNRLISYPNLLQSPYAYRFVTGKSLNVQRLLHYTGVDPLTGQYTFGDKYHDGVININPGPTDDLYEKDLSIKFDGGVGSDVSYKGLEVNCFFVFRKQELPGGTNGVPGNYGNQPIQALKHWQKPGDISTYSMYTTQYPNSVNNFLNYSDGIYSDASFIRLKSLSISYDMPQRWLKKTGIEATKVYLRGENLFVLSRYNGIDPESPGFGSLPPFKTIIGGIQFNF
jgi:hypothetical protein